MATNEDLRNIYDKDSTEIFVNDIMSYLLVDNGRKGDANLKSSSAKLGKMTRHEFGEFCNVLVTTLVNFKMNDALVLQILESMHEVDTHFVARREDCICFLFGKGKCCGRCDATVRSQIFIRLRNLVIF